MKAVFVVFNQSLSGRVKEIFDQLSIKGFTQWINITGSGSDKGIPHEGTHTWPELNNAFLTVIGDEMVPALLEKIQLLNKEVEDQGLRAFTWNIESVV